MLKVRDLVVAYGGIEALKGISVDVPDGQIVTLIGANGAGKSTLLRTIMGLVKPRSGSVEYNEENIKGLNSQHIVSRGITLVPEGRRVFPNLTVLENLRIGWKTCASVPTCARMKRASPRISNVFMNCSPGWKNGTGRWPVPCPAASSRCWLWDAPS